MEPNHEEAYRPLAINPFRISQPLGGVLALQGIYKSVPILHGAQGCAESIKTVMSRHFREPISIQNIAMHEYNLIFGGADTIREVVNIVMSKHKPDVIGIIGTSLTEVVGEDLLEAAASYGKDNVFALRDKLLFALYLPDYEGSMESGYAKTVYSVLQEVIRRNTHTSRKRHKNRINLLAGSHLSPGDVMELKEIIASFGLEVIVLPDLSSSLTGHLLTGHTPLSRGGVPLDYLNEISTSAFTIAIGGSMESSARLLQQALDIPYRVFPALTGLQATDDFFRFLQQHSRNEVQVKYRWQRQFLLDTLLDTRSVFRGKKVVAALDPDHLVALHQWLVEAGVKSFRSVASAPSPALEQLAGKVRVGDLEDLEAEAAGGADLWISNSHGEQAARRNGVPFIPLGFPIFNRFGSPMSINVGYKGTVDQLNCFGNILMNKESVYR
ncbi:MAG: hypothetical protein K0R57_5145 [Paenibacillaceae bacterium]|jgi:nitrogenase molybdenum-iron protein NifN|nr:hypothetical protein [Paenibacillaceae bacterium]